MIRTIAHWCIGALMMLSIPCVQAQTTSDSLSQQGRQATTPPDTTVTPARSGSWFVDLPNGGRLWASETASLSDAVLNVSASSVVAVRDNALGKPLRFVGYSNYSPFIQRAEVLVFRGRDNTLNDPLVALPVEPGLSMEVQWDGQLPGQGYQLQEGSSLQYVLRVYGANGAVDETYPRRIELLSEQQLQYQRSGNRSQPTPGRAEGERSNGISSDEDLQASVYGSSNLRIQNIPIVGSSIRIQGQNIPMNVDQVSINGRSVPVDRDHRFVAEYLLPAGPHQFRVRLSGQGMDDMERVLDVKASQNQFFMVGIADVTASKNGLHGNLEPIEGNEQFEEDLLVEGRLAFYLKAKVKGKYLITAHTDTREEELQHMFDGFFDKDPQDLFRRLDPDRYYPVYGDDGATYRDVNAQGKFYVRVNWDKSELLWGNFSTGLTGNETARYQRGLYGAAMRYKSPSTTELGQSKVQLSAFGSDAQTVYGHNEFVATGASVYYMRHTDMLPGSEQVVVELRDATTGLTEQQIALRPDVDYEIDYLQGWLILKEPVAQIVGDPQYGIIRDGPQPNLQNVLLVDYEYIPGGLTAENITAGARGKAWLGDHIGIGGTYVNEGRGAADDYQLAGADLTLQAGRGTYLKVEGAQSDKTQAPVFFSDNGGLNFTETVPETIGEAREGNAYSVEGRLNLEQLFGGGDEQGYWARNQWNVGSWLKERDGGFSVTRRDFGYDIREWGAELDGEIGNKFSIRGRVSKQELTPPAASSLGSPLPGTRGNHLAQGQLIGDYRINDYHELTTEVRRVEESENGSIGEALLGALGYEVRVGGGLELYGLGQTAVWTGSEYEDNDRVTGGARYLWRDRTTLGGEYSHGSRGDAFGVNASHQFTQDYSVYGRYGWSPDYTSSLFGPSQLNGFSVGQRWRATDRLNIFHETQQMKSGADTGLGHSLGLNFVPDEYWRLGLRLQGATLEAQTGQVDRRSATVTVGAQNEQTNWSSKFEYREDFGAEERTQLVTTQRIRHKINEAWRVAARLNYADTDDRSTSVSDARFFETNFGLALRPWNTTRWSLLGKLTYLYDRQSFGQLADTSGIPGSYDFDQKSFVSSLEGIYQPHQRVEITAKGAVRIGELRNRLSSANDRWFKSTTQFGALQLRYQVWGKWDALGEARWRGNVESEDNRRGFLVGIDRRITDFLHLGVGYNFTDFSDNLTDLDYNDRGWFINIVGIY